jgi:DNA-binding MarR family transcriptional regulator
MGSFDRQAVIEEFVQFFQRRNAQLGRVVARQAKLPLRRGMSGILSAVAEQPRSITQLADREGLAQPTVTRMIARLESLDLVERTRRTDDRRVVMIQITPEGVRVLEDLRSRYREVLRAELTSLSDEELKALETASDVLQRLIETLQEKARAETNEARAKATAK